MTDYLFPDYAPQREGVATRIIQGVIDIFANFLDRVESMLPISPFSDMGRFVPENPLIEFVLWVVPVGQILAIIAVALPTIAAGYGVKIIARWAKVIG